jgi:hypothetical protein
MRTTTLPRADDRFRVALVTGACSGIGRALAERLGALGYELVIVSHREGPLGEAADAIRRDHHVSVHPIVVDLARPAAASEVFEAVRALGLEVDILVNNAGMFFFGEVADADVEPANALLQLHVVTPSLLATLFCREMRGRRRGHVLFVSSISAWRDFPGIGYYGASKKYLRGFARSLRSELAVYGVNVTCVSPGATATGLYDPNVVPVERAMKIGIMMTADAVAEAALGAMFAGKAEHVPGVLSHAMALGAVATPQWAIDALRRHAPFLKKAPRS